MHEEWEYLFIVNDIAEICIDMRKLQHHAADQGIPVRVLPQLLWLPFADLFILTRPDFSLGLRGHMIENGEIGLLADRDGADVIIDVQLVGCVDRRRRVSSPARRSRGRR